jgi:PIN domain nuclease of toxin-antitoxin system
VSVVLDTHVAIWYLHRPASLSPLALKTIRSAVGNGHPVFLSSISIVESIYLAETGRLPSDTWQLLFNAVRSKSSGVVVQPLDEAVAEVCRGISRSAVPDMPDRIIAATAVYLGLPLVTRDRRLQAASLDTIW